MKPLTFSAFPRELLEAELNRCNSIMVEDGKRLGELQDCISKLAKLGKRQVDEIERLRHSLNLLCVHLREFIQETGGCDHSVGICLCPVVRDLDRALTLLGLKPLTEPDQPDPEPGCNHYTTEKP